MWKPAIVAVAVLVTFTGTAAQAGNHNSGQQKGGNSSRHFKFNGGSSHHRGNSVHHKSNGGHFKNNHFNGQNGHRDNGYRPNSITQHGHKQHAPQTFNARHVDVRQSVHSKHNTHRGQHFNQGRQNQHHNSNASGGHYGQLGHWGVSHHQQNALKGWGF